MLFANLFGQLGNNITRISGFEEERVFFQLARLAFCGFLQGDMKPHKSWTVKVFVGQICVEKVDPG